MAHATFGVSNVEAPLEKEMAHAEHQVSNANTQKLDVNTLPASNNRPVTKVRNDGVCKTLCKHIRYQNFDDVQKLLNSNPNLDLNIVPKGQFELPLHLASWFPKKAIVESLLAAGATPDSFCAGGRTALQCSANTGHLDVDVLRWLTSPFTQKDTKRNYINLLDRDGGQSVTHYVTISADQTQKVAAALTDAGADWTLKDKENNTPFDLAVNHGNWIMSNYLAGLQWDGQSTRISMTYPDEKLTVVKVQNTAYIQYLIQRSFSREQETLNRIFEYITPNFRSHRNPNDPVGGCGREATCFFKKFKELNFTSLTIPYFSFEFTEDIESREKKYLQDIQSLKYCSTSNFNTLGLQCVSTLDEYCHTSLDEGTLADRNRDQVLSRYQKEVSRGERVILTVPQLWIWELKGDSIIMATPDGTDNDIDWNSFYLLKCLTESPLFPSSISTYDVEIAILISESINKLNSSSRLGLPDTVFNIFEKSISKLSAEVREYTRSEALNKNDIDREKVFILQITGIREELSMIQSVFYEQECVWRQFTKAKFPDFWFGLPEGQFLIPQEAEGMSLELMEILERPQTQFAKYKRKIANLDADAERVEKSIEFQLDLKSKHASLQEAHLTTLMSSAVIGFTIVTIIFTPLAFLVSLFALSVNKFQDNQYDSTLTNGAPFYDYSFIGKWMITIEFISFVITGLAIWVALKITTDFSTARAIRNLWNHAQHRLTGLVPAWWKREKSTEKADRLPLVNTAQQQEVDEEDEDEDDDDEDDDDEDDDDEDDDDEDDEEEAIAIQQPEVAQHAKTQGDENLRPRNIFQWRTKEHLQQDIESNDRP